MAIQQHARNKTNSQDGTLKSRDPLKKRSAEYKNPKPIGKPTTLLPFSEVMQSGHCYPNAILKPDTRRLAPRPIMLHQVPSVSDDEDCSTEKKAKFRTFVFRLNTKLPPGRPLPAAPTFPTLPPPPSSIRK
mmetsp:Transcript_30909/g.43889  ORF Transcript_30909/g.43889 Transcript_30909/m.43889 type:complete len:131 (-) Transcript_30909:87-479(-)|eukprot:CAMPEP_0202445516 /NCGR_PEP_ID=MMETSP1360-20130828/4326_1 /ASSEMBLY_ACC=CAM_ASM_000848 /TAXON_ID=515479 /ORGANISM="Licmophora paradoxa, Strain CCMP2313" /LENGTH=130 /DNA_ID=CAMNT_0049061813 /DNA_START=87 /DNA_END=479 /DNA_ORIENTATION=+